MYRSNKSQLVKKIEKVEEIASASKWKRMSRQPFRYFFAIIFREVWYRLSKVEKEVLTDTFFNEKMCVMLPSSTDIYLTGGKSHDSEIRLARFLIEHLDAKDTFIDVGAHYGYFTLLASQIVGSQGKVFAFEASPRNYEILFKNTHQKKNITSLNLAISNEDSVINFYEFPNLYSEYNTIDIEQFENESWFGDYKPDSVEIQCIQLDDFLRNYNLRPKIIKIDVEGAEAKVIEGLKIHLSSSYNPVIVMEYLSQDRGNISHQAAEKCLRSLGYIPHAIGTTGELIKIDAIDSYMEGKELDSDNIVFVK